jgi:hypothetical protein
MVVALAVMAIVAIEPPQQMAASNFALPEPASESYSSPR